MLAGAVAAIAACSTPMSDRARRIKWATGPGEILGCEYLGVVDGSSTQSGMANSDIGENNARNEALETAVSLNATHVLWRPTSFGMLVRVSGDAYSCVMPAYDPPDQAVAYDPDRDEGLLEAQRNSCEDGKDAVSCFAIGRAYLVGDQVALDRDKAVRYLSAACRYDSLSGCLLLGEIYERDDNASGATRFYAKACELGAEKACKRTDGPSEAKKPASKPEEPEELPPPQREILGVGTCFSISKDGLLATAAHVVDGASAVGVQFEGEEFLNAEIVAISTAVDLAVLKVERSTKEFLPVVASTKADLGEKVFSIGFPQPQELGWEPKFSEGSVSSLSSRGEEALMQLSVPIHQGNSGGAVMSETGTLLGVVVMRIDDQKFFKETGSMAGEISFAVKSGYLAAMLDEEHKAKKPVKLKRKKAIKLLEASTCKVLTISNG